MINPTSSSEGKGSDCVAIGDDDDDVTSSKGSTGGDEDNLSVSDVSSEGVGGSGCDETMEELMEQMDEELGATEVSKSFEKLKVLRST